MTSLAEAFGLGRGCFGREGVLRCTGTFPDSYRHILNGGELLGPGPPHRACPMPGGSAWPSAEIPLGFPRFCGQLLRKPAH